MGKLKTEPRSSSFPQEQQRADKASSDDAKRHNEAGVLHLATTGRRRQHALPASSSAPLMRLATGSRLLFFSGPLGRPCGIYWWGGAGQQQMHVIGRLRRRRSAGVP